MTAASRRRSVDPTEIEKFSALAEEWWDPDGKMKPLHALNPLRLAFLRDQATALFGLDAGAIRPLAGLKVLDIGCGGGLLSEPLARLGAEVTGIDAAERNLRLAEVHAEQQGLAIDYRLSTAEELAASGGQYDLVVSLEVLEHVADVEAFLEACCELVRPGGGLALATLNRTTKAFLLAVVGAEYLLRWLPRGTHDWNRFLRPAEVAALLRRGGIEVTEATGVAYNPLVDSWRLAPRDLDVNYMLFAKKPGAVETD